jgi:propionate CoA-transferase
MVPAGATIGVGWLSDTLATAVAENFLEYGRPRELTVLYATAREGRTHGLNRLAHAGLIRRVIGGQWQPVPGMQALARDNAIEAYSLPTGVIRRLFRDVAAGLPDHLTRSGLGTLSDPRHGGGKLNRVTNEAIVRLVHLAGEEALMFRTFPIDIGVISVAFMAGTAALATSRDNETIARAAHAGGGIVIAELDKVGTLEKLPRGLVIVPDTTVDVLIGAAATAHEPQNPPALAEWSKRDIPH